MIEADWIWGFVGGLLIGGAAALYLLVNGRIMGISGILGGLVDGTGRATWASVCPSSWGWSRCRRCWPPRYWRRGPTSPATGR